MTMIRCGLCTADLVFCGLCGRWFHHAAGTYKCSEGAHVCGTEPAPAALHAVTGLQARRYVI